MPGLLGSHDRLISFSRPLADLAHRGGDDHDIYRVGNTVHGSTATITRHRGHVLAFDGALWNRDEIKREIAPDLGPNRTGTSRDPDLVIRALARWGLDALARLDGMFALSWSSPDGQHVIARDRYGECPLYVWADRGRFVWSSERKALPPRTPARLLDPGTALDLATGDETRWYTLPQAPAVDRRPIAEIVEQAVLARLDRTGPIACLLSGGLDSAMILSLAARTGRKVCAFTARLENDTADLRAARELSVLYGIRLVEVDVPFPSAASLSRAVRAIEIARKPQVEIAAICLPLARAIRAEGFEYVLSGEGADELFGGYEAMAQEFARSPTDLDWSAARRARLDQMARGSLVRANLSFATAGVQCRLPYLDRALVETALAMPRSECPPGKVALKRAAEGIVPPWIIRRARASFQQGTGMTRAAETAIVSPGALYERECAELYGLTAP